jgi:acetoin utilization protein AcuB
MRWRRICSLVTALRRVEQFLTEVEEDMRQSFNNKRLPVAPGELDLVIGPTEVADVMTGKVVTLSRQHSFDDVVKLMNNRFLRHCVVVDSKGKIEGVISDRDLLRALARTPNRQTISVDQIMTRSPYTVRRNTPICDAVAKMLAKRINCLPVVSDDGTVCGIVTSTDLLKSYQQLLQLIQKQAG